MKASDLSLFIVCLGVGLGFATFMGIGGSQFEGVGFFSDMRIASVAIVIGLIAGIALASAASYLAPKGVLGTATGLYGGFVGVLIALSAGFFYSLPYETGPWVGSVYVVFASIVLFLDLSERVIASG